MFEDIIGIINKSKKIGISFHVSPDGDSIGSSLGLLLGLKKINKDVVILSKEPVPEFLSFLPNTNEINPNKHFSLVDFDCIIVVDCGDLNRVNYDLNLNDSNEKRFILVNMDHHVTNQYFGDLNFVDSQYSSMGEIVYLLLEEMNIDIDQDMAQCLYTSIMTDCGSFKYSNTTELTHKISGKLISTGIDFPEIHRKIYENKKFDVVKLSGKVIEGMSLECSGKLCVLEVTSLMLSKSNIDSSDVSDFVNIGTEIEGVEVVIFLKENEDKIKVSLRSKTKYDVRKVAELFGGGGHVKAAGFTYHGSIDEIRAKLIEIIKEGLI